LRAPGLGMNSGRGVPERPRVKPANPLREYGTGPFLQLLYVLGLVTIMYMLTGLGKKAAIVC
jgi:hypothetical protein